MGKLRKIGKKIGKGIKSVGRKLKKGFGKVAKAFGKLGPLGTVALSFILPGVGSWISSVAQGTSFLQPLAQGLVNAGNFVKDGIGRVFNRVTDAIEYSMNKVSGVGKGAGDFGTKFRNWASERTGGFIEPSTTGVEPIVTPAKTITRANPDGTTFNIEVPETVISPEAQVGIGGPEMPPPPPKNMVDPVYVQGGVEGETLRTGYYEAADLDKYYKGVDTTIDIQSGKITDAVTTGPLPQNKVNIKTTGDLPIPKGSTSYFNRGKQTFKAITPITTIGANIQAQEDMEAYQAEQARLMKQEYFQDAGMSLLASGSANPNISFIDFTNPNPTPTELFNLQNSYSGILS